MTKCEIIKTDDLIGVMWWDNDIGKWVIADDDFSDIPKIDAVPVVRCEECVFHTDEEPGMVYCPNIIAGWVNNDFYCADGKREEVCE